MLKALGYPTLAVGLVMGAQTLIPTAPAPFVPAPVDKSIAVLPLKAATPAPRKEAAIVPPKPVLVTRSKPITETKGSEATSAATVTVSPWRTAVVSFEGTDGAPSSATSATAASTADRYELARSIQRELKRVGCYYGEIDGSWGLGSKRALAAFMDRVNASLPYREPDYILLALIRAQPAAACAAPCPQGQAYASDGRCVPNAILARAMKKNGAPDTRVATAPPANAQVAWTAELIPSVGSAPNLPPPAPLIGRMSVGGPRPDSGFGAGIAVNDRARMAAIGDPAATGFADTPQGSATYTSASLNGADNPSAEIDAANLRAAGSRSRCSARQGIEACPPRRQPHALGRADLHAPARADVSSPFLQTTAASRHRSPPAAVCSMIQPMKSCEPPSAGSTISAGLS